MTDFSAFVRQATATDENPDGHQPYPYQERLAAEGFPDVINVPTASGKTVAAVLPHAYRLLHGSTEVRAATPRRLVLVLPTRGLIEQAGADVARWLSNLGLSDEVAVHVLQGGQPDKHALHSWRLDMAKPAIIIGTVDMVISRLLMRGYGLTRGVYPIDAALMANGTHFVVDEVQLAQQGTVTLRQIQAFRKLFGTFEPTGLTVMSATVDPGILDTVDNSTQYMSVVQLSSEDRASHLGQRLEAQRTVRHANAPMDKLAMGEHREGTLTLVIVNSVKTAMDLHKTITKAAAGVETMLLHSRFRGTERSQQMSRLKELAGPESGGAIIISTQVIEAGVDIDATTLITEAAPWPSLVQRAGRCNRNGHLEPGEATIWWTESDGKGPYDKVVVAAATERLQALEGESLTAEEFHSRGQDLPTEPFLPRVLRRRDMVELFDTTPDLAGADVDVRPYIREDDDTDVQVAWLPTEWWQRFETPKDPTAPRQKPDLPSPADRCAVPIAEAKKFVKDHAELVKVFDPAADRYVTARMDLVKPQSLLLVDQSVGRYTAERGFDSTEKSFDAPEAVHPRARERREGGDAEGDESGTLNNTRWLSLEQHLNETRDHAQTLVAAMDNPDLSPRLQAAVVVAAYLHDLGKAHDRWQVGLRSTTEEPGPDGILAKSPGNTILRVTTPEGRQRRGFRHELMSVYYLMSSDGELAMQELGVDRQDYPLVRYLVGAHHGRLRLSARDPHQRVVEGAGPFGSVEGELLPPVTIGRHTFTGTTSLELFRSSEDGGWTEQAHRLLEEYGPFKLAYLETLVRMADWRASSGPVLTGEPA